MRKFVSLLSVLLLAVIATLLIGWQTTASAGLIERVYHVEVDNYQGVGIDSYDSDTEPSSEEVQNEYGLPMSSYDDPQFIPDSASCVEIDEDAATGNVVSQKFCWACSIFHPIH